MTDEQRETVYRVTWQDWKEVERVTVFKREEVALEAIARRLSNGHYASAMLAYVERDRVTWRNQRVTRTREWASNGREVKP